MQFIELILPVTTYTYPNQAFTYDNFHSVIKTKTLRNMIRILTNNYVYINYKIKIKLKTISVA